MNHEMVALKSLVALTGPAEVIIMSDASSPNVARPEASVFNSG